jgi:wobble nucleotide-excising tRNase
MALCEFNKILKRHNDRVSGADEVKRLARVNICQHFAVEYLRDCEVLKKNYQIGLITNRAAKCSTATTKILGLISIVRQAIKDASIGAQTLNENLAALLPNDNIVVVKLNETDFEIQRGGRAARNMSEGERTAVAFSYFLTKLAEGGNLLEETIVVVDDPISSLDENHIYAVHSICENHLSKAKQLFVLTHNSGFFGLTKDWMKKLSPGFFMAKRQQDASQEWYAEIVTLPRMLRKFKSNYQYTYYCLKVLDQDPNPQIEHLVNVPIMIRSLLELYLGFVFPESGGLDDKLPRIVGCATTCGEILKFANENSHAHSLTQATQSPTFIVHSKKMLRAVLGAIGTHNPEHVASLEAEFLNEAGNLP